MKKIISFIIIVTLIVGLCNAGFVFVRKKITSQYTIRADQTYQNKFVPAAGKTMLFIGQDADETTAYINSTGITPAGMMIYTNLSDLSAMASSYQGTGNNQAGRMDFQDWITRYPNTAMNLAIWASDQTMLNGIANGDYDENIRILTRYIRNSRKPVYVRFGYEFDGPWNQYYSGVYKRAYKHFVDVTRNTVVPGTADNISFVWHSAAFFRLGEWEIWPGTNYNRDAVEEYLEDPIAELDSWYPGDEYVDWVGISWFAWEHEYQERAASIRRDEAVAFARQHNKPVMIAEAAPKEIWQPNNPAMCCSDNGKLCQLGEVDYSHTGDSWDNWYEPLFDYIEENDIEALSYINQDWNAQQMWRNEGGWGDSRVQTNAGILTKWENKINESRYLMSSNSLYSQIGFDPDNIVEITTEEPTTSEPTTSEPTTEENADPNFIISKKQLALTNGLRFYLKAEKTLFTEDGYTDPSIVVSFNNAETVVSEYIEEAQYYAFPFNDIAPHQMGYTFTATLHAYKNGEEYVSPVLEYSIEQYCYDIFDTYEQYGYSQNAKLFTLLIDMLNYGVASQEYMTYEYGTEFDHLVNENLTATQLAWGTSELGTLVNVRNLNYETIENPCVTWMGTALNLRDSIVMRLRFQAASIDSLTVKARDDKGNEWVIPQDNIERQSGTTNFYYVYFDQFNVGRMCDSVYVTVYQGETPVSNTCCFSIESYAQIYRGNANYQTLSDLVVAMMKYGNSVKAYIS